MSGKILAQRCLSWMAAEEELGDLEELFGAASEVRYVREAAGIGLSILRRKLKRGGEDMVRLFLWAIVSVFLIFSFLSFGGGEASVYIQPFEWGVILSAMLGFGLAGRRLGAWRVVLADLRRADRLSREARHDRRSDFVSRLKSGVEAPAEFAHMGEVVRVAHADRLMAGGIALFRERSHLKLKIVERTAVDAYVGSAIAGLLGVIHTMGALTERPEVLGHLIAGALCAPFFGMILGRAVLAPMADRLSALYEQEAREMEAFRLAVDETGIEAFPTSTFEALA